MCVRYKATGSATVTVIHIEKYHVAAVCCCPAAVLAEPPSMWPAIQQNISLGLHHHQPTGRPCTSCLSYRPTMNVGERCIISPIAGRLAWKCLPCCQQ
jgi:hypothetical protein